MSISKGCLRVLVVFSFLTFVSDATGQEKRGEAWYQYSFEMPDELTNIFKRITKDSAMLESVMVDMNKVRGDLLFKVTFNDFSSVSSYQNTHVEENSFNLAQVAAIESNAYCFNWEKNILIYLETLNDTIYTVMSPVDTAKWVLSDEEKAIGEYICKKAVQYGYVGSGFNSVKQVVTEAWYTPQVPLPIGPQEFIGLPGMIVEVKSKNSRYLLNDYYLSPDVKIECPHPGPFIDQKEYYKLQAESTKKLIKDWKAKNKN